MQENENEKLKKSEKGDKNEIRFDKKKKKKLLRRFKDVRSFLIKKLVFIRSWTDGERRE